MDNIVELYKQLANEINECFRSPFLPNGFVKAHVTSYGTLWINIGDRDGEFDEDGICCGSGCGVNSGAIWDIDKE